MIRIAAMLEGGAAVLGRVVATRVVTATIDTAATIGGAPSMLTNMPAT